jgi:V/A-type H+-transporting ATPase subunit I
MIVSMSKVMLLCTAAARERTLAELRDLGVVHLAPRQLPEGESVDAARREVEKIRKALEALPARASGGAPTGRPAGELVEELSGRLAEIRQQDETLAALRSEQARLAPYGHFEPDAIRQFLEKGVSISLYQAPRDKAPEVPDDLVRVELNEDKSNVYFAVIGRRLPRLDAQELRLPEKSLKEIEAGIARAEQALADARAGLAARAAERPVLQDALRAAQEQLHYQEARAGMETAGPAVCLTGFCPDDAVDALRRAAGRHGWGLRVEEPEADDRVPTLLRNPRWVNPIKPLLNFIGISPGYSEVDISAIFLVSFSVFAGMLVGDAAYGLIFLGATLYFRNALKRMSSQLAPLLIVMSACTIVWGLLTGSFFGASRLPRLLAAARVDWLTHNDNVMFVCFLMGAIHLTIAHAWNMIRIINRPQALAQLGWILNTWAMFFIIRGLVLRQPIPGFAPWLVLAGALLIALFMTPVKALKTDWVNHIMLPLNLISNFVDVVSYVRLFAVGLATFAVAQAFNKMALGGGVDGAMAKLGAGAILFAGHTLNIVMATMGVVVHGIRLNTLEFSGHLGLQWSGVKYKPFARGEAGAES